MDSWRPPSFNRLPGKAEPLSLYDTARRGVFPSTPQLGDATMYVCGITPYDATHLGHAATMISFDLINRIWRDNGHEVNYVQNVTDVDDPLFERADRDGEDWIVLGMRETALFREDMESLAILPPRSYIGAVESMDDVIALVERLQAAGMAYELADGTGDIYFPVADFANFGSESHYDQDTMLAFFGERGGDPQRAGKRDPLDALLWRGERQGEPSWASPMGAGRPGWHIECAAIAMKYLGEQIDVQGGGNDLIFPHHEMSIAHAEAATKTAPFARHCVHAGMIGLDGEKMSKSKGNLVFVSRLRADGVESAAIRLGLLDGHYRDDRQWNNAQLATAQRRLSQWRLAMQQDRSPDGAAVLSQLRTHLSNDLDTVAALACVDEWAESTLATEGQDDAGPAMVKETVQNLLGVTV